MTFVAKKNKNGSTKNFSPSSLLMLLLDPGSEIRDPRRTKIRIRDKHLGSATLVLGSMPASFNTVESEGRQMKQC